MGYNVTESGISESGNGVPSSGDLRGGDRRDSSLRVDLTWFTSVKEPSRSGSVNWLPEVAFIDSENPENQSRDLPNTLDLSAIDAPIFTGYLGSVPAAERHCNIRDERRKFARNFH